MSNKNPKQVNPNADAELDAEIEAEEAGTATAEAEDEAGEETEAEGPIATAEFYQTDAVRERGQAQLQVEGLEEVYKDRGIGTAPNTISANAGRFVVVQFQPKTGDPVTLYQGDTHSFWAQHQKGAGKAYFDRLLAVCKTGQRAKVKVLSVEFKGRGATATGSGAVEM